ncbi:unnamed protein product [Calypogeia fissa]
MAYIQGGELKQKRTIWRLSILTDFFWAVIFYIRAFCTTMFSMEESNAYGRRKKSDGPRPRGYGGGGGGGGGWGGGGGTPPPGNPGSGSGPKRFSDMDSLKGFDHNAPCGTCCGG